MAAEIVSLPVTVSESDADILFGYDSSDFTHTLSPINGFDELFNDFKYCDYMKLYSISISFSFICISK